MEARAVRQQERHGGGDGGCGHAARQHLGGAKRRDPFGRYVRDHFGRHEARDHGVDPDPARADPPRQERVRPRIPALAASYAVCPARPCTAVSEDTLTIEPARRGIMRGITPRQQRRTPPRLASSISSQASPGSAASSPSRRAPALFTAGDWSDLLLDVDDETPRGRSIRGDRAGRDAPRRRSNGRGISASALSARASAPKRSSSACSSGVSVEIRHPAVLLRKGQLGGDVGDALGKERQLALWHRGDLSEGF